MEGVGREKVIREREERMDGWMDEGGREGEKEREREGERGLGVSE